MKYEPYNGKYSTKKITWDNGKSSPIPNQKKFSSSFIKSHGCSIAVMYLFVRYFGKDKPLTDCQKYLSKHTPRGSHAKYSLSQVAKCINKIYGKTKVRYVKSPSADAIRKELAKGHPVGFEEKDPTHSVMLCYDKKTCRVWRIQHGVRNYTTVSAEVKKRASGYYGGCVFVR